ncbi:MAG TPA: N-acetyltransferase [Bacteroidetes bacterium]|nr:N-acetyltransferase [Bacteroidota bacterium]
MDMPLVISPLSFFDVPQVAEMIATNSIWQRYGIDYDTAYSVFAKALDRGETLYSGRIIEQIAGFIWFDLRAALYYSGGIRWLAVHPDFQNKGIGKLLMQFAEDKIFEKCPNVFLLAADFNASAHQFYETLGYEKVGELRDYFKRGITEWIYRKTKGPVVP